MAPIQCLSRILINHKQDSTQLYSLHFTTYCVNVIIIISNYLVVKTSIVFYTKTWTNSWISECSGHMRTPRIHQSSFYWLVQTWIPYGEVITSCRTPYTRSCYCYRTFIPRSHTILHLQNRHYKISFPEGNYTCFLLA